MLVVWHFDKSLPPALPCAMAAAPAAIGILAMDCYFPQHYVKQSDLGTAVSSPTPHLSITWRGLIRCVCCPGITEEFDKVSAGKYTVGLGQQCLAFVNDREDVYSIALTGMVWAEERGRGFS